SLRKTTESSPAGAGKAALASRTWKRSRTSAVLNLRLRQRFWRRIFLGFVISGGGRFGFFLGRIFHAAVEHVEERVGEAFFDLGDFLHGERTFVELSVFDAAGDD